MQRRSFLQGLVAGTAVACGPTPAPPPAVTDPFSDPSVGPLLDAALQAATEAGASYADARLSRHRDQRVATREARVTRASDDRSEGLGVRVLVDGGWGFAATNQRTVEAVVATARAAVARARQNRRLLGDPVRLAPVAPAVGRWRTPMRRDAFEVPLEEKVARLLAINQAGLARPGVSFATSSFQFAREHKFLATTDGARVEQELHRCDPSFTLTSVDDRSGSFRTRGSLCAPQGRSWDFVEDYDWDTDVAQAAEDVVALHTAEPVEPGVWDLILLPSHLWLTIHESIGHPTELDRALGHEANYAGTSFLTPDKLGKERIGSPIVSLVAERTTPGALATCGWDDDGAATSSWDLVRDGVFVGYQTTRDQAHWVGEATGRGCSYAQSWRDVPFQRMPNVNLLPGATPLTLAQLVADTERAILLEGRGSYSIDHQRYNFQFGGQVARVVRGGKLGGLLRDVAYQCTTPRFWQACDAICSDGYAINGSFHDGKGEPGQSNAVSHGCAPARFRGIDVLRTA